MIAATAIGALTPLIGSVRAADVGTSPDSATVSADADIYRGALTNAHRDCRAKSDADSISVSVANSDTEPNA